MEIINSTIIEIAEQALPSALCHNSEPQPELPRLELTRLLASGAKQNCGRAWREVNDPKY